MTDEEKIDWVKRYVEAKKITPVCELCGINAGWAVIEGDDDIPIIAFSKVDQTEQSRAFHQLVILECGNCGNIRMLARQAIKGPSNEADNTHGGSDNVS